MQFRKGVRRSLISATVFVLIILPSLLYAVAQSTTDQRTKISISLDKNSYHLGDSVEVTVNVYTSEDASNRNQPIAISLYSPTGLYDSQEIMQENIGATGTYSVSHTFKLSSDAPTGRWSVVASYLDAKAETIFLVSASAPPQISVRISSDKSLYKAGEIAKLKVVVEPVSNEPVIITVIAPTRITYLSEKLTIDAAGVAQLAFSIKQGYPLGTWEARAEYRDSTNSVFFKVEDNLTVEPLPKVSLFASPASIKIGEAVSIEIRVSDDYISPILLQYSTDQGHWNVIAKVTPAEGYAKVSWISDVAGKVYLRGYFEGNDRYKSVVSNTVIIAIEKIGAIIPEPLSISIKVFQLEIILGDRVSIYVDTSSKGKTVFVQFSTDKLNWMNILETHTPGTVTWIPEQVGEFYLRAFFAGDREYRESVSNLESVIVKQRSSAQTLDVFTQLGGKGVSNMNGGVFNQGERLIIYALVQGSEPIERTVVNVNIIAMSKTTEIIEPVLHKQIVAGANGLATIALDTSGLEPDTYIVTASLEKSPDTLDGLQFQIVASTPPDTIPTDKITPKLHLTLSPTSIKLGEGVMGNVQADPPISDSITIQSSDDAHQWHDVMKISLSNGYGRFSWIPDSVNTVYLRVYYPGSIDYNAMYSEPSAIEVGIQRPTILLEKRTFLLGEEVLITVIYLANTDLNLSIADPGGIALDNPIRTDDSGQATFSLQLRPDGMVGKYFITITDPSNEKQSSVTFFVDKPTREPELKERFVRGELLLGFREDLDVRSLDVQRIVQQAGGEVVKVIEETNTIKIRVPAGAEEAITQDLLETDTIIFGSTNKYLVPTSLFEDELSSELLESYEMLEIPDLWPQTMQSKMVAVIDSGIEVDHQGLKSSVWINDDDCNNRVDDDSNGFVDDCNGWNFFMSNNDINDEGESPPACDSHGTHIAGTINAIGNGWVSDLAPGVAIMPLKVSGNMKIEGKIVCVSTEEKVLEAVIYAVNNGAKIINISLGCPNQEKCEMPALGETFRYAHENGVLVVVPAGNEKGIDDWQDYSQYVLEISSVHTDGEFADYSNTGPGIDLAAPGTHVYSTKIDNDYGTKTGTSHSAAMVSGCASVLLSSNELLTNTDIEAILKNSAKDLGAIGRDNSFGYGVIDCDDALKQVVLLDYELASMTLQLWNSPLRDITLELALPRALIDSRTGHGLAGIDGEFLVFADDKLVGYEETDSTESERMLRVLVPAGATTIEILGTVATPEFGLIAAFVLTITLTAGIVMNKRYRRLTDYS